MSERPERASVPVDGVAASVEGGFVATLDFAGTPDAESVRRVINEALLDWYERERGAHDALEAALQRAERLGTPTVIGQLTLADPPAWIASLERIVELGDDH